ncbi:MAG: DUF5363 domain-containing protein [Cardiobacteriaceae bacterium]|nr:DUF5363 domain-containing protein [Cardiobacteriaceae bacterium]
MEKKRENLFKWLWRKYNEFYDEAGFSQVGGCRRCVPFIKEDPPLEKQGKMEKWKNLIMIRGNSHNRTSRILRKSDG